MKVTIDRFEGDFAVVELPDGTTISAPRALFPGAREADVVDIQIDPVETEKRMRNMRDRLQRLMRG